MVTSGNTSTASHWRARKAKRSVYWRKKMKKKGGTNATAVYLILAMSR